MVTEQFFNKALFENGDIVRARNTDLREDIGQEVVQTEIIGQPSFRYQIIYFEDGSWHDAFMYEPNEPNERKAYYKQYEEYGLKAKTVSSKPKVKQQTVLSNKLNISNLKTK